MKIMIRGVHVRLTANLRQHVEKHLVDPLRRFLSDGAAELFIILVDSNGPTKGGLDKECRVTAFLPRRPPIHAVEVSDDLYKSIDLMKVRLERLTKREIQKGRDVPRGKGARLRSRRLRVADNAAAESADAMPSVR